MPSLDHVTGGSIIWILVSDMSLVQEKYGERAAKLVCLEAGHLMQNLCLVSTAIGASTVPAGGFFETLIAEELGLCRDDSVSYVGISGKREIVVKDVQGYSDL